MIVRPWQVGDSERIVVQPAQVFAGDVNNDFSELSAAGLAWTAEDGELVIGCGGLMPLWENRALAWTLLSESAGPYFPAIHRAALRFLVRAPYRRIEAHVDVGFDAGIRWMKLLGFELEAYKKAFRPDGADMLEFVRIRSCSSYP